MRPQPISGARALIDARGGYRVVAEALGWPLSTVHTFWRNDAAPQYRWGPIEALPKKQAPKPADAGKRRAAA